MNAQKNSIVFNKSLYTIEPLSLDFNITIGAFCAIEATSDSPVVIGSGSVIGHHVSLCGAVTIKRNVEIRSYGNIGSGSEIGENSKLLYGGSVYRDVTIGNNCIISGNVADGTIIGNDVSFLGSILHNYRTPGTLHQLTDGVPSPSPHIRDRAVVGEGSFLVGDIEIGFGAYVAAGMIVKCDVPDEHLICEKGVIPLSKFWGFISSRKTQK